MQLRALEKIEIVTDGENSPRITDDGYMVANVRAARTGIQLYTGDELGVDAEVVRVYRPESSVFDTKSLHSFAHKPATLGHPPVAVDASNHNQYAVGHIGGEVARDGEFVRVPLMLTDAAAIKSVKSGRRELSMGYAMRLDFESGTTPSGEAYDAVQRDIKINHIAVVQAGRAGHEVRIGDSWCDDDVSGLGPTKKQQRRKPQPQKKEPPTVDLKTITVDGISVQTTDQGAEAIQKLQGENSKLAADAAKAATDAKAAADEAKKAHDAEIAAKDAELGKKDAEIKKLTDAQLTDAQIDQLVADRSKLVEHARKFLGDDADLSGKSAADIQSAVVVKLHGADAVADKSAEYIQALFDHAEPPKTNQVHDALRNRKPVVVDSGTAVLDDKGNAIDMGAIYAQQARDMENAHLANFAVGGSQ